MIKLNYILVFVNTICIIQILGLEKFTIPKNDVVHIKSGLILRYLSEYRPANKIITFTVSLPMYSDMCFLIPREAMGKIPDCQDKEATVREINTIQDELQNNKSYSEELSSNKLTKRRLMTTESTNTLNKIKTIKTTTMKKTATTSATTLITTSATTLITTLTTTTTKSTTIAPTPTLPWEVYTVTNQYGQVQSAYYKPRQPSTRQKRALPVIIAIGAGIASSVISAINFFQVRNVKSEIRGVKEALQAIHLTTLDNQAQILHIIEGQLKVTHELGETQIALNKTIDLVNEHSRILRTHAEALRRILNQTISMQKQLDTVTQTLETHFIHESIENIMLNKLNLHFVHYRDMPKVIKMITQAIDFPIEEYNNSLPMNEILTRLLVQQQIDFAPMPTKSEDKEDALIGKIMFTSYFAVPTKDQSPFSIYEVVTIPFNKDQRRVQLANMPTYIGIESKSQQFIRWSKEEASTCEFELMPSCRESPIRRKEFEDDCIYQILTDTTLTNCRVKPFPDKVFIRRVGEHWIISTLNKSKCHSVPSEEFDEHVLMDNEELLLPELALLTVNNEKVLACDRFIIPRAPIKIGTPINLIYNGTINRSYKELIDLQAILENETKWEKLPYINSDMQAIIDFISSTPKPTAPSNFQLWQDHPISMTMIVIIGILILIVVILGVLMFFIKRKNRPMNSIIISMPSMKELSTKEFDQDNTNQKKTKF